MTKFIRLIQKHRLFFLYIILGAAFRLWNFPESLYFINDQGRDFVAYQEIASGDAKLTGPQSGIDGFYIGPAWFYAGVPGFILTGGNPYLTSVSLVLIWCLSLPLFWLLSHQLFPHRKVMAKVLALLLAVVPMSLTGSLQIWNPLLAVPMMAGVFLSLIKARHSRWFLGLAFLLLGIVLQSEFAYGIFFVPALFLLVPWVRKKVSLLDWSVAAVALGLTLVPQVVFELKHHFVMSKALIKAVTQPDQTLPWLQHFPQRAWQLYWSTGEFFVGPSGQIMLFAPLIVGLILIAGYFIWQKRKAVRFEWQLCLALAIVPYLGFLVWRGNQGHFFTYYFTAHFIFLAPLVVLGIDRVMSWLRQREISSFRAAGVGGAIVGILLTLSLSHWYSTVAEPNNQAGMKAIEQATARLYEWRKADKIEDVAFRVFTPNLATQQYDYMTRWVGKKMGQTLPRTVSHPDDQVWYVLIEPYGSNQKVVFDEWYSAVTQSGVRVRHQRVGILIIETWMTSGRAAELGLPPIEDQELVDWSR